MVKLFLNDYYFVSIFKLFARVLVKVTRVKLFHTQWKIIVRIKKKKKKSVCEMNKNGLVSENERESFFVCFPGK